MAIIGYVRVSTEEQNTDRQTDALQDCQKVFIDRMSGSKRNRPELDRMLEYVREGDVVEVESLSRLARSTKDLLSIVETLREKGVDLVSLKESIDTTTPQGRFTLTLFGALAELERETLLQRQREGIDAAKARGKHLGRPRYQIPSNFEDVVKQWRNEEITAVEAYTNLGMSKATFYRAVKKHYPARV
jgi:DNA invertase Pin-like site-specific DNA recombinase